MILTDTSVWVAHLKRGDPQLTDALGRGEVLGHRWVAGELSLGGTSADVVKLLLQLPQAVHASDSEITTLISSAGLAGAGIGWVDAGLLASTRLTPETRLLTYDRRLREAARRLGVDADDAG